MSPFFPSLLHSSDYNNPSVYLWIGPPFPPSPQKSYSIYYTFSVLHLDPNIMIAGKLSLLTFQTSFFTYFAIIFLAAKRYFLVLLLLS